MENLNINEIMKEKHFCRCCLSEECYKDMSNTYYNGNKKENYYEMLLNIFNINLKNNDGQRCLICEECVSKLQSAAAFKNIVLKVQEAIEKAHCWENIDANILNTGTEKEDADDFDDFNDDISDKDFNWENFTQNGSQKGIN
ncbi:hypothetical protein PYW07_013297 [Mythimna separata]|uniref:ZAD domain-containing protein n=1 Tax=Mythimna separata TaxID=271217 RepID=A0AAD8DJV8_MYTSE|nr:hypothetical protein PYW07_013297 [Mythimna separata]